MEVHALSREQLNILSVTVTHFLILTNSGGQRVSNQHSFMLLEFSFRNADHWQGLESLLKRFFILFQWDLTSIISYLTTLRVQ